MCEYDTIFDGKVSAALALAVAVAAVAAQITIPAAAFARVFG